MLRILIDHYNAPASPEQIFGKTLKERILNLKYEVTVQTFDDLEHDVQDWESATLKAIREADVVITIISSNYLSFVTEAIEAALNKTIDSNNRYLFPILFQESNWESNNWLVKSKLIPESNIPLAELPIVEADKVINDLVQTIATIADKYARPDAPYLSPQDKPTNSTNTVFISHDHDDADFAELLKLQLEKNGIESWLDTERLKIGQDWREEIDDGIANSLAVIAIMTPEARKSEYVTYEWAFAWGKGIKIFPIMLKQTPLHPRLESLQYLDFTKRTSRPYDALITSIKELMP